MPCCQAASTVAAASSSVMLRNMLPRGAAPKPSGPLIILSLMLMIPPRFGSRGPCQPSSLPYCHQALRLDTASDRHVILDLAHPLVLQEARDEDRGVRPVELLVAQIGACRGNPEATALLIVQDRGKDARRIE